MSIHDVPDEMNFLTDQKEVLMEKHDMTEEEGRISVRSGEDVGHNDGSIC